MKIKIHMAISLVVLLSLVLASLVACSSKVSPSSSSGEEKTSISIYAGRPGEESTLLSYALANFINEDSKKLKASVITTGGMADGQAIMVEQPDKRATSIVQGAMIFADSYLEKMGWYPLFMMQYQKPPQGWVTFDPKIKTVEDFAGKTISVPREVPVYWDLFKGILEDAGVLDKVKLVHGSLGSNMQALIDGTVQVAFTQPTKVTPVFVPTIWLQQMQVKGKVYFVDSGKERIARASAKIGVPPCVVEIPPGTFGETQTSTVFYAGFTYWFGAGLEMNEDIAYEITKIGYERGKANEFANYLEMGKNMGDKLMPFGEWTNKSDIEKWYQPGALKFYRESGVPGL